MSALMVSRDRLVCVTIAIEKEGSISIFWLFKDDASEMNMMGSSRLDGKDRGDKDKGWFITNTHRKV